MLKLNLLSIPCLCDNIANTIARSLERSLDRSLVRTRGRSITSSRGTSIGRSVARPLRRSNRSVTRTVARQLALAFVYNVTIEQSSTAGRLLAGCLSGCGINVHGAQNIYRGACSRGHTTCLCERGCALDHTAPSRCH